MSYKLVYSRLGQLKNPNTFTTLAKESEYGSYFSVSKSSICGFRTKIKKFFKVKEEKLSQIDRGNKNSSGTQRRKKPSNI
jgi:hypothetical protein